jgi:NADPH-dependent curcumin reductase CurA
MPQNRQILIDHLPGQEKLSAANFRLSDGAAPTPGEGEALVRVRYVGLDAANRAWMMGRTYRSALEAGQVMAGAGLGEVVESRDPSLKPGDLVQGDFGWQDYVAQPARHLLKTDPIEPLTHHFSVYGVAGLTAYLGLMECGQPKPGETVVVSAAAGSVGTLVGQIAKLKGCKVVGIAGGAEKGELLRREFGFDATVDYKAAGDDVRTLFAMIQEATGGGTDVYFDNVAGMTLDAILFGMKDFGRVAACGAVSYYDGGAPYRHTGLALIVSRRITIRGFIVSDLYSGGRREAALAELRGWVESGQLKVPEEHFEGLESLPGALIGLLAGENVGKRIVKIS